MIPQPIRYHGPCDGCCVPSIERCEALEAELAEAKSLYAVHGDENLFDVLRERDALKADFAGQEKVMAQLYHESERSKARVAELEERLLDSAHWPHVVEDIYDPMCVRCAKKEAPNDEGDMGDWDNYYDAPPLAREEAPR